jgi:hypothetical protein
MKTVGFVIRVKARVARRIIRHSPNLSSRLTGPAERRGDGSGGRRPYPAFGNWRQA